MINAKDLIRTEIALDELGIITSINNLQSQRQVWTISGIRTLNSLQPNDQGELDLESLDSLSIANVTLADYIELTEISTPSTPAANHGRLYVKDDGSGESALYYISDAGTETALGGGGGGGATTLPGLTDVDDALLYTSGFVLRANGSEYTGAQLAHSDLSGAGTNTHATIDAHIDSDTTVHANATNLVKTTGVQTIAGAKTFSSVPLTTGGNPTVDNELARKAYVDAVAQGLEPKQACRIATTTAGTLASDFENGDTIDGVVLATNDRILIKNQATGSENGIYTVNASGAPTRATDSDTSAEVQEGTFTFVSAGTANAGKQFVQVTVDPILGTDSLVYTQLSGGTAYTASNGVLLSSTDFQIDLSDTNPSLEVSDGGLRAKVDDSSIERAAGGLQVKALGVTNAMLAGSIADSKLSQITTADKVSGAAITLLTSLPSGAGKVPTANLGSGTPDTTTFLRGDQSWAVPAGSGAGIVALSYSKNIDTDSAAVTVSNTTAETSIYSYSLPANTLGTEGILRIVVSGTYLNNSGANRTQTVRFKYGGTTMINVTSGNIATSATTGTFTYTFYLMAHGATNVQQAWFTGTHESGTGVKVILDDGGTAAVDSTSSQTIDVTVDSSAATATQTLIRRLATINMENAADSVGAPTDASYVTLAANGNLSNERVLTGTSNQITVTDGGAGAAVTLSTPQSIATSSDVTFGSVAVGGTTVPAEGIYRPTGAGNLGFAVSSTAELLLTSTALSPFTTDGSSLGTTSLNWSDLFLDLGSVINWDSGDVTLTHSANLLTLAGGGLTATAGTVTLATIAGAIDAGGATSFEIPNGAGGTTVDATGEVTVDSTSRTLNFYDGTAEVVLNPVQSKSVVIVTPTASSDYALYRHDVAATLTKVSYLCIGGTNWVGQGQECDANGINGANVHTADVTATAGTVNTSTTFSNASIDAGDYFGIKTTSISGTPTYLVVTWYYRENA